ncbi:MAG: hypothetical protein ACP5O2_04095 [Bacteroidales bacterium]
MKSFKFSTILIINLLFCFFSGAQTALYQWRDHLPYSKGIAIELINQSLWTATPYGLFYYDPQYQSISRLNKVNGLSDVGIADMVYSETYKTLVVAYSNTNLDLVKEGRVVNLSDIKRKPILGNKVINRITLRDKLAYLSCGFGIVVVDIDREEIRDTWYIGPDGAFINVLDITFDDTYFYAATAEGIYRAEISNPFLSFYGSWEKMTQVPVPNGRYNVIRYFDGRLVVNNNNPAYNDDTIFIFNQATQEWSKLNVYNNPDCYRISVRGDKIVLAFESAIHVYGPGMKFQLVSFAPSGMSVLPRDGVFDKEGNFWYADARWGLVKTWGDGWNGEAYTPNGPYSVNVFDMDMAGNSLWVASGGRKGTWEALYMKDGVYHYDGTQWNNYNRTNTPSFDSIMDMVCVAVDPKNPARAFAGSWGQGLLEFNENGLHKVWDETNSTLEGFVAAPKMITISGVAFDEQNNLWVANSGALTGLHRMSPDGTWKAFPLGGSASGLDLGNMMVDRVGQKWILLRKDHSVLVVNEKNTQGPIYKILTSAAGNGALPGNRVFSFASDLDGAVWLGTDAGVAVIYNPSAIFSGSGFDAQRVLIEQDGYVQYLLENETVTAIAIDGANRKWMGTEKAGVFLFSPDGTKEIYHFTEDNSPLLSNSIIDIAIAGDGEVFIATSAGIVGFKGDSPSPSGDTSEVYAYPNPVRPSYDGPIAIKGLPRNTDVKIASLSGKLVYHTVANGTQAVWNGRDYDGKRVQSGVYLVFVANEDGSETVATKILFIN